MKDFHFIDGEIYDYDYDSHEETGILIFYIKGRRLSFSTGLPFVDGKLPMVEDKFRKYFDDLQYLREEKLKQLFDDISENS